MSVADEYKRMADECYRLAAEAKTETDRLACLDLARTWIEAASRHLEMTPAQIREAQAHLSQAKIKSPQPSAPSTPGLLDRVLKVFRWPEATGVDGKR